LAEERCARHDVNTYRCPVHSVKKEEGTERGHIGATGGAGTRWCNVIRRENLQKWMSKNSSTQSFSEENTIQSSLAHSSDGKGPGRTKLGEKQSWKGKRMV